jgi:hypothetical protein
MAGMGGVHEDLYDASYVCAWGMSCTRRGRSAGVRIWILVGSKGGNEMRQDKTGSGHKIPSPSPLREFSFIMRKSVLFVYMVDFLHLLGI